MKEYYIKNKNRILEQHAKHRKENPDYDKEYSQKNKEWIKRKNKKYYIENKEEILGKGKEYREKHKEGIKKRDKKYYINNYQKISEYYKQWRKDNTEKIKEAHNRYHQNNKEKELETIKQWRINNPEKMRKYRKKYRENNLIKIDEINKKYRENNKEKIAEYYGKHKEEIKKYLNNKYQVNLKFQINRLMSNRMRESLKGNKAGKHWETLVDYTLNDLIKHLKSTMPLGYIWKDFMEGRLHIDHIIPIRAFKFETPEDKEFKQCWALENLQLLPAKENLTKNSLIINPILLGLLIKSEVIEKCLIL